MSRAVNNRGNQTKVNNRVRNSAYVQGTAVRKLDVQRQIMEPSHRNSNTTRKNREKAKHMSLGYVLFLAVALAVSSMVLMNYIRLQSSMTTMAEDIARYEKQLNNMKVANDENYSRIISSVDLEDVKRVAIGELGMVYPQEGQIIEFTSSGRDFARKVESGN